ncbi:unnamed protein product [Urochloa humidicola]
METPQPFVVQPLPVSATNLSTLREEAARRKDEDRSSNGGEVYGVNRCGVGVVSSRAEEEQIRKWKMPLP